MVNEHRRFSDSCIVGMTSVELCDAGSTCHRNYVGRLGTKHNFRVMNGTSYGMDSGCVLD